MNLQLGDLNTTSSPPSPPPLPPKSLPAYAARVGERKGFKCHGILYDAGLVVPAVLFVIYLGINARKNVKKLWNGRSYIMITYYALLWLAAFLNLAWCFLQGWQCTSGKELGWNFISMFTESAMLCLEISIVGFLLQDDYATGLQSLARTFLVSGIVVAVDFLFKAIYTFGFRVPLFVDNVDNTQRMKWGLWIIHKLLLTAVYGYILFVHFSKWREKLPPRPAFYNYIILMFGINAVAFFSSGLAGIGASLGIWLFNFLVVCYHSLYLPYVYATFLVDFFQEEDFLLDNAYYSEMKDAGFFDDDWD